MDSRVNFARYRGVRYWLSKNWLTTIIVSSKLLVSRCRHVLLLAIRRAPTARLLLKNRTFSTYLAFRRQSEHVSCSLGEPNPLLCCPPVPGHLWYLGPFVCAWRATKQPRWARYQTSRDSRGRAAGHRSHRQSSQAPRLCSRNVIAIFTSLRRGGEATEKLQATTQRRSIGVLL